MSVNETKWLCSREDISDLKIGNNEQVGYYKQYRYLRIVIENYCRDSAEIKNIVSQGRKMIKVLNSVWWSEEIARNRKYRICNIVEKNILTHESEACRMTKREKWGILVMEMDALRRSCGISKSVRIRNKVIKIKIREIVETEIQSRQVI